MAAALDCGTNLKKALAWLQVKKLPKKAAPSRFGRKLTASQKENATHICVDCGYIYCDSVRHLIPPPCFICL